MRVLEVLGVVGSLVDSKAIDEEILLFLVGEFFGLGWTVFLKQEILVKSYM